MKSFNGNLKNGFDKFRKTINNSHAFRKAHNTLSQINSFALPVLSTASFIQPQLAPVFAGIASGLKTSEIITKNLKK